MSARTGNKSSAADGADEAATQGIVAKPIDQRVRMISVFFVGFVVGLFTIVAFIHREFDTTTSLRPEILRPVDPAPILVLTAAIPGGEKNITVMKPHILTSAYVDPKVTAFKNITAFKRAEAVARSKLAQNATSTSSFSRMVGRMTNATRLVNKPIASNATIANKLFGNAMKAPPAASGNTTAKGYVAAKAAPVAKAVPVAKAAPVAGGGVPAVVPVKPNKLPAAPTGDSKRHRRHALRQ